MLSSYRLEPAPGTGKAAAGMTNAEEATRLLTERRRQARAQKELEEEKKRELEEEKRWVDWTKCFSETTWSGQWSLTGSSTADSEMSSKGSSFPRSNGCRRQKLEKKRSLPGRTKKTNRKSNKPNWKKRWEVISQPVQRVIICFVLFF